MTRESGPGKPLTVRAIVLTGLLLALIAAGAAILLLTTLGSGSERDRGRLDALRTAATIVVGGGGAAALLLAARRQRSTELSLVQTDHDAAERRVTELYSRAAEQLGSDKAPVRLAGLYAMERVAQENPKHRQTVVNVICAYLRMPFDVDDDGPENRQEREVRITAQRILSGHLRPGELDEHRQPIDPPASYWPGMTLDLTGATLIDFSMLRRRVYVARFANAAFHGSTVFTGTAFDLVTFEGATFAEPPALNDVSFRAERGSTLSVGFVARTGERDGWEKIVPA